MKIPLSWVREFVDLPKNISLGDLENAFVNVGFEVENIDVQGEGLSGPLVVARVLAIEELTGNKKPIRYVELDCGEKSTRFVICGATNFSVGDLVVAALPGAILPGDFVISARETYGKTSNGMICSARELGISEEHSGIVVLPPECAKTGDDAVALLEINDVVVDAAVNPDRGYALSIRGLARELAASLGCKYVDPILKIDVSKFGINSEGVQISVEAKDALSIVFIRTIAGFDTQISTPLWMSRRIEKCGMRSISLAVDITNYVMLELGQPLHAFDAEKIDTALVIRRAGDTKTITTLDNQKRNLDSTDLVVADKSSALALAGVMGGASSEVTDSTSKIALEARRGTPHGACHARKRIWHLANHFMASHGSHGEVHGLRTSPSRFKARRAHDCGGLQPPPFVCHDVGGPIAGRHSCSLVPRRCRGRMRVPHDQCRSALVRGGRPRAGRQNVGSARVVCRFVAHLF